MDKKQKKIMVTNLKLLRLLLKTLNDLKLAKRANSPRPKAEPLRRS